MKHYLLIGLLLLSFNANAIDGVLMMVQKSLMPVGMMMGESVMAMQTVAAATASSMHQEMTADRQLPNKKHYHEHKDGHEDNNGCEQCGSCLAHCMGAIISSVSTINFSSRFTFESEYLLWTSPRTASRLLRPPQSLSIVV